MGTPGQDFYDLDISDVEIYRSLDASQDIRLQTTSYDSSSHNLLYLNFEEAIPEALRDQSGHFSIARAQYFPSQDAHNGKQAALFNGPKHGVRIKSGELLWNVEQKSFTIEMWFKPLFFHQRTTLFEKTGLDAKLKSGLEIGIHKHHLFVRLTRLFRDSQSRLRSLSLRAPDRVRVRQWQHMAFSYQTAQSRLTLYLNGKEQDLAFARDPKQNWRMQLQNLDRSPFLLASRFIGLIDEFRIARRALSTEKGELNSSPYNALKVDFNTQRSQQKRGQMHSGLLHLPKKQAVRFAQLSVQGVEPEGAALNVYVRHSHTPFNPQGEALPWRRLRGGHISLPSFRYFQWKAELRSDPLGKHTPVLKALQLNYTSIQPPPAPQGLRLVADLTEKLRVCLEWEHSPQHLPDQKTGYYVYYGLRPGEYMGRLKFYEEGGEVRRIGSAETKPVLTAAEKQLEISRPGFNRQFFQNRTRLFIDNQLIEKNLSLDRKKRLPFLRYDTNYYFAVSAYDNMSESKLSNETYAVLRPDKEAK